MDTLVTFLLVAAVTALIITVVGLWQALDRRRVTVWEWETGLLFVEGRFARTLPPGRYLSGLFGRSVIGVSTRPRQHPVTGQEALTADGFQVKLGAVVEWRVTDAHRLHVETGGYANYPPEAMTLALQLALREVVTGRSLATLLADRAEAGRLEAGLRPPLEAVATRLGARIERVVLRDLILPAEVRRMLTEVERARQEGLAALERARGEQAALRSLANAARMLRGNPELQALRTLQALSPAPGRPAPTLVLGAGAVMPVAAPASATAEPEPSPEEG